MIWRKCTKLRENRLRLRQRSRRLLYRLWGAKEPRESKDSVEVEDRVIYRLADNEVVGITIIDFKTRTLKPK